MKCKKLYKDKEKFRLYHNRQNKINYDNGGFVGQPQRRYTDDEDWFVMYSEMTDREIAKEIRRSVHSIQKRRWLLRKRTFISPFL